MTALTEALLAMGGITVCGGVGGYFLAHAARTRVAVSAAQAELHKLFDKHAANWRTCTCESCSERRAKAGVK